MMERPYVTWKGAAHLAAKGEEWKVRLLNENGKHNKFWEVYGTGTTGEVRVRYGKIGATGTVVIKDYEYARKNVRAKLGRSGDKQYRYDAQTDLIFPDPGSATPKPKKPAVKKKKAVAKKKAAPKPPPEPPKPAVKLTNKQKLKRSIARRMSEADW